MSISIKIYGLLDLGSDESKKRLARIGTAIGRVHDLQNFTVTAIASMHLTSYQPVQYGQYAELCGPLGELSKYSPDIARQLKKLRIFCDEIEVVHTNRPLD
jgi:hypothetical protein